MLSDFAVTIPEMGTVAATRRPIVLLTSNATANCPERSSGAACTCTSTFPTRTANASCRRGYPDSAAVGESMRIIGVLRTLDIRRSRRSPRPSTGPTLLALGAGDDVSGRRATLDDGLIAHARVVLNTAPTSAIKELKLGDGPSRDLP